MTRFIGEPRPERRYEVVADDGDIALELPRRLDNLGGWASVYPQLVDDLYFALRHQVRTE
jgi:hypothetical protein